MTCTDCDGEASRRRCAGGGGNSEDGDRCS